MRNDLREKTLEETWKNKEKFYEDTKGLSMLEIITKIENRYSARGEEASAPKKLVGEM